MADYDAMMARVMKKFDLPGAQLAVAKNGRTIHSQAYGIADAERGRKVKTDSWFRLGSVAKTFTQIAILQLVDQGKLRLDERAFAILAHLQPKPGAVIDSRLGGITVLDLLRHEGGFDAGAGFEPMFPPWSMKAAQELGVKAPPECETIIRFRIGLPLDFTPGMKSVYSNFGYCVLGRVIEAKSGGKSYESHVRDTILRPLGIGHMRIAGSRLDERAEKEVRYYHQRDQTELPEKTESVFAGQGSVPWAYGGYYLRATDAHGGWIGSAKDMVKIACAIDGQRGNSLLKPESVRILMSLSKPKDASLQANESFHYAHAGALQGSNAALLERRRDGIAIGFTANSLPVGYREFFEALMAEMESSIR